MPGDQAISNELAFIRLSVKRYLEVKLDFFSLTNKIFAKNIVSILDDDQISQQEKVAKIVLIIAYMMRAEERTGKTFSRLYFSLANYLTILFAQVCFSHLMFYLNQELLLQDSVSWFFKRKARPIFLSPNLLLFIKEKFSKNLPIASKALLDIEDPLAYLAIGVIKNKHLIGGALSQASIMAVLTDCVDFIERIKAIPDQAVRSRAVFIRFAKQILFYPLPYDEVANAVKQLFSQHIRIVINDSISQYSDHASTICHITGVPIGELSAIVPLNFQEKCHSKVSLGAGTYGFVNLYTYGHGDGQRHVAIKSVRVPGQFLRHVAYINHLKKLFFDEIKLVCRLPFHENIIVAYPELCCRVNGNYSLALQYLEDGDLRQYLHDHTFSAVTDDWRLNIASGVAEGLSHLHDLRIYHGDLSLANILLQPKQGGHVAKIGDFGKSKTFPSKDTACVVGVGSIEYVMPSIAKSILNVGCEPCDYGVCINAQWAFQFDAHAFMVIVWMLATHSFLYETVCQQRERLRLPSDPKSCDIDTLVYISNNVYLLVAPVPTNSPFHSMLTRFFQATPDAIRPVLAEVREEMKNSAQLSN